MATRSDGRTLDWALGRESQSLDPDFGSRLNEFVELLDELELGTRQVLTTIQETVTTRSRGRRPRFVTSTVTREVLVDEQYLSHPKFSELSGSPQSGPSPFVFESVPNTKYVYIKLFDVDSNQTLDIARIEVEYLVGGAVEIRGMESAFQPGRTTNFVALAGKVDGLILSGSGLETHRTDYKITETSVIEGNIPDERTFQVLEIEGADVTAPVLRELRFIAGNKIQLTFSEAVKPDEGLIGLNGPSAWLYQGSPPYNSVELPFTPSANNGPYSAVWTADLSSVVGVSQGSSDSPPHLSLPSFIDQAGNSGSLEDLPEQSRWLYGSTGFIQASARVIDISPPQITSISKLHADTVRLVFNESIASFENHEFSGIKLGALARYKTEDPHQVLRVQPISSGQPEQNPDEAVFELYDGFNSLLGEVVISYAPSTLRSLDFQFFPDDSYSGLLNEYGNLVHTDLSSFVFSLRVRDLVGNESKAQQNIFEVLFDDQGVVSNNFDKPQLISNKVEAALSAVKFEISKTDRGIEFGYTQPDDLAWPEGLTNYYGYLDRWEPSMNSWIRERSFEPSVWTESGDHDVHGTQLVLIDGSHYHSNTQYRVTFDLPFRATYTARFDTKDAAQFDITRYDWLHDNLNVSNGAIDLAQTTLQYAEKREATILADFPNQRTDSFLTHWDLGAALGPKLPQEGVWSLEGNSPIWARGPDDVNGTELADVIFSGSGSKVIRAGDGDDIIVLNLPGVQRLGSSPSLAPYDREIEGSSLTGSGHFEILSGDDRDTDTLIIGVRKLVISPSGSTIDIDEVKQVGEYGWVGLTEAGRSLGFKPANVTFKHDAEITMLVDVTYSGSYNNDSHLFIGDSPYVTTHSLRPLYEPGSINIASAENGVLRPSGPLTYIGADSGASVLAIDKDYKVEAFEWISPAIARFAGTRTVDEGNEPQDRIGPQTEEAVWGVQTITKVRFDRGHDYWGTYTYVDPTLNQAGDQVVHQDRRSDPKDGIIFTAVAGLASQVSASALNDLVFVNGTAGTRVFAGAGLNHLIVTEEVSQARALTLDYSSVSAGAGLFAHLDLGIVNYSKATDWLEGGWANVIGSQGDDVLVGNQYGNRLEGGAGNDRLYPGNSAVTSGMGSEREFDRTDYLYGGTGNDEYYINSDSKTLAVLHEKSSEGSDTVMLYDSILSFSRVTAARDLSFYDRRVISFDARQGNSSDSMPDRVNFMKLDGEFEKFSLIGDSDFRNSPSGTREFNISYGVNSTAGNDIVLPNRYGREVLFGGDGDDLLIDTVGGNMYVGGRGNDTIYALTGGNRVLAGAGDDTVFVSVNPSDPKTYVHLGMGRDTVLFSMPDSETHTEFSSFGSWSAYRAEGYDHEGREFEEDIFGRTTSDPTRNLHEFTPYLAGRPYEQGEIESVAPLFTQASFGTVLAQEIFQFWDQEPSSAPATILDFRVDEDRLGLYDWRWDKSGDMPSEIFITFVSEKSVRNAKFDRLNDVGPKEDAHALVLFDNDTGRIGFAQMKYKDEGEGLVVSGGDFLYIPSLIGSSEAAARAVFSSFYFNGYSQGQVFDMPDQALLMNHMV